MAEEAGSGNAYSAKSMAQMPGQTLLVVSNGAHAIIVIPIEHGVSANSGSWIWYRV